MNHATLIAVSSAALVLASCGNDPASGPSDRASADPLATLGVVPGPGSGPVMSSPTQSGAQTFANAAAGSDRFMIEMAKLAETRAAAGGIRDFARRMIEAQTESTARLAAAAATSGTKPAPRLSAIQQQTLEALSAQSGAAFDAAYARAQADAQQAAVQLLESYAADGSDTSLRAFAREMAPRAGRHLEMARKLL